MTKFKNYSKCDELSDDKITVMIEDDSLPINVPMVNYQIAWEANESPCGIRKYIGKSERTMRERMMEHISHLKGTVSTIYLTVMKRCSSKQELAFYEGLYIRSSAKHILNSAFGDDVRLSPKTRRVLSKYMTNELLVE